MAESDASSRHVGLLDLENVYDVGGNEANLPANFCLLRRPGDEIDYQREATGTCARPDFILISAHPFSDCERTLAMSADVDALADRMNDNDLDEDLALTGFNTDDGGGEKKCNWNPQLSTTNSASNLSSDPTAPNLTEI